MVEISNDVHSVLPMMIAVMIAKRIADSYTHGLYHSILEMKCVPFLDPVPFHPHHDLDLYQLKDMMQREVVSVAVTGLVRDIYNVLNSCEHNAFAVVSAPQVDDDAQGVFLGSISRHSLFALLQNPSVYGHAADSSAEGKPAPLKYSEMASEWDVKHFEGGKLSKERAQETAMQSIRAQVRLTPGASIDLTPYMNTSAYCLPEVFSVKQGYILFRACGLRHLFILDQRHHVVGVCTRKDFIGHDMEQRLPKMPDTAYSREYGHLRESLLGNGCTNSH